MRRLTTWNEIHIKSIEDITKMIKTYRKFSQGIIFFDTETTGLHIIKDIPFLLQLGFYSKNIAEGWLYIVEDKHLMIQTALTMLRLTKEVCGHNIKFDIHMLMNIGVTFPDDITYHDTQIYIRGAHDALTTANGGPPLGLKEYCTRYVEREAKDHERLLLSERTSIAKEYNVKLKNKLYAIDKQWTLARIESYFKDVLNSVETLPKNIQEPYKEWFAELPQLLQDRMTTGRVSSEDIPYNMLNRANLIMYAKYDIIYTVEVYLQCYESIVARENTAFLEAELKLIPALVRMERCGFEIDKEYIINTTKELAQYLRKQREELYKQIKQDISVGQHALIKNILANKYELRVPGTGKEDLSRIYDELKHKRPKDEVTRFIGLVQELRTLEKWYSTYLLRFVREMKYNDRVYTQIHQVGTVSGRVTSDFQQFPKFGINKEDGSPLFNPRAMIKTSPGFKGIAYLDYSQIELRVQAMYTILVGYPDRNLCRAYMPFECKTKEGIIFDYTNKEHIDNAYTWEWFHLEDNESWEPTDVHAATTRVAFPNVEVGTDEFKKLRGKVGKRVNFAKNYGAQFGRIKQMFPEYDDETIHHIDDAYYEAFPGVKKYHEYCYNIVGIQSSVSNLFGIKYYGLSGHKLINCLVQGSSAYFLKERIYNIDKYIQSNKLKTRLQMQIHDELSYEIYPGEEHHIEHIRAIMQSWEDTIVPIVADLEFTQTTWADKKEVDTLE